MKRQIRECNLVVESLHEECICSTKLYYKKNKVSLLKSRSESNESFDSCEVWRLVTRQNFLTIHEIGRFLLMTSKALIQSMYTQDEVWTTLLHARFSSMLVSKMLDFQSVSPKSIFFSLNKEDVNRPSLDIRELRYNANDYILIVNCFISEGQAIFSKAVSTSNGDDMDTFLKSGLLEISMDDAPRPISYESLEVTIHLYRIPDHKSVCLFKSDNVDYDDDWVWMYGAGELAMEDLDYTRTLHSIVSRWSSARSIEMDVGIETKLVENAADTHPSNLCTCGQCWSSFQEVLKCIRIDTRIWEDDECFSLSERQKDSNVGKIQFAHFVENLYGWNH